MPTISVYLDEKRYRYILDLGEKASTVARKMLEEKIDSEIGDN